MSTWLQCQPMLCRFCCLNSTICLLLDTPAVLEWQCWRRKNVVVCVGYIWRAYFLYISFHHLSPRLSFEVWPDVPWLWKSVQSLFINVFLERSVRKWLLQFDGSKSLNKHPLKVKIRMLWGFRSNSDLFWTSLGLFLGNHGSRLTRFSRLERISYVYQTMLCFTAELQCHFSWFDERLVEELLWRQLRRSPSTGDTGDVKTIIFRHEKKGPWPCLNWIFWKQMTGAPSTKKSWPYCGLPHERTRFPETLTVRVHAKVALRRVAPQKFPAMTSVDCALRFAC